MKISKAYNFISNVNSTNNDELISSSGTLMNIDLQSLAEEEYQVIINLLPDDNEHATPRERETFEALDISYSYIPVDWDAPTAADLNAFEEAIISAKGMKIHIHCAANYRATAFYGLYAHKHLGWSKEQIIALTAPIWQLSDYPVWEKFVEKHTVEHNNGI